MKLITLSLCVFGITAVAYGMYRGRHPIFIAGLLLVIAGYILIRRKLKESIRNTQQQDHRPSSKP